jgi:ferredoxin/flavodoxin---NADP+ reductase
MTRRPFRVAVVGSGPSGVYAAEALLKKLEHVSVDLIDRLPTPYGLVRYGVAPDHQKIKSITKMLERTCQDPRVRFLGNVTFGRDLTRADLRRHYDAGVYAVGASADRALGVPGEDLEGSLSATEFVAWYNGHPDFEARLSALTAEAVAVVGMGNVALDVARILAKTSAELETTDIADQALAVLRESPVREVYVLGRRGPAQARFTTKELRDLGELADADVVVDPADLDLDAASEAELQDDPVARKNVEVLREFAARPLTGRGRRLHLRFLVSPVAVLGESRVEGVRLERNRLELSGNYLNAVGTGVFETLPVQMVLRSVGYRGVPLPGLPFDERRAVIPNRKGLVLEDGEPVPGEYAAGWIKRGPTGVIGTNKADAMETVETLLENERTTDLPDDPDKAPEAVTALLKERGVDVVDFGRWLALDKLEQAAGAAQGRPRVKVTNLQKMLDACRSEPHS